MHADLCGHISPKSLVGEHPIFLLVVDDHSRYMWVELLKSKDQALECFKKIKNRPEVECNGKLMALRTYRGESSIPICFQFSAVKVGLKITLLLPILLNRMGW